MRARIQVDVGKVTWQQFEDGDGGRGTLIKCFL